jgi:hypothetical protein
MPGKPDIYQALEHSEAIPANLPQPQAVTSAMNDLTKPKPELHLDLPFSCAGCSYN